MTSPVGGPAGTIGPRVKPPEGVFYTFRGGHWDWHDNNLTWDGSTLTLTGTTLTVSSTDTTAAISSAGCVRALSFRFSTGTICAQVSGSYHQLFSQAGNAAIFLGGTGDPANYYDNTTHYFRSIGGGSTLMTLTPGTGAAAIASGTQSAAGNTLAVTRTSTATSGNVFGGVSIVTASPSSASSSFKTGLAGNVTISSGSSGISGGIVGLDGAIDADASANTFASCTALRGTLRKGGANTITLATGVEAAFSSTAAGTVTAAHGFYMSSMANSGGATITTAYGLRIASVTVGATNYAIHTGAGLVSIGDTTDSTSKDTGSIVTEGGLGVEKALYTGTDIGVGQRIGLGGGGLSSLASINVGAMAGVTGTTAIGLFVNTAYPSSATSAIRGAQFSMTGAASTAITEATGFFCASISAGSGGSITRATGALIHPQNSGTNNCGILISTASPAYTGNYAILSLSTDASQFSGSIKSDNATAGVGYATGAGGTVTQGSGSGKATSVTLNKVCGTITMDGANLNADTTVAFTFTNSAIAATDLVVIQHDSVGTLGGYNFAVTPAGGSATVSVRNVTPGNLAEAIVLRFAIIKAVTA